MAIDPPVFGSVETGTFEPSPCSPPAPDGREALVIAAPRSVGGEADALPVCGVYRVLGTRYAAHGSLPNEIVLVAVDVADHVPRSGNLSKRDFEPEPAVLDTTDPDLAATWFTGWFNVDLFEILPDLPRTPGKYRVFATIGDLKSAPLEVEVTR
jgi:hypothetical protein